MRPLRFLFTISFSLLAFFFLLFIGPWRSSSQESLEQRHLGAYFNWRTPSSLFPPSAIISLTDDNSTFFLARPAAFGPLLPAKSLSSQLWVGSGFGDDHLGRTGSAGSEGELGCSDVPGWNDGDYTSTAGTVRKLVAAAKAVTSEQKESGKQRRSLSDDSEDEPAEDETSKHPAKDDGTDDHLHHPLPASEAVKQNGEVAGSSKKPAHADIQSLQEGAEIAGKIVLLSRGGCGFLEKVKWVQRRGGVALIVGDDIRGGPLVTMYARGDTSNITIPALFTSHTTAHLLSSLIPSGGAADDLLSEEAARLGLALGDKSESGKAGDQKDATGEKPNFTTTIAAVKATSTPKMQHSAHKHKSPLREQENENEEQSDERSWFWSIFSRGNAGGRHEDSRRPPSSGNIDWVLQREFDEEEYFDVKPGRAATTSTAVPKHAPTKQPGRGSSDGFVIGVQDWRDPDLVAEQKEQHQKEAAGSSASSSSQAVPLSSKAASHGGLKGGSITPGSGEYDKSAPEPVDIGRTERPESESSSHKKEAAKHKENTGGWFGGIFSSNTKSEDLTQHKHSAHSKEPETKPAAPASQPAHGKSIHLPQSQNTDPLSEHEGLWVTLTPTSMSSSPFFDTLLVLVISPLVTLTVVYALLLLRSRIRRRRWRAPKSVVERLPVRTYQTISSTTPSSTTSSISSPVSASTPLLPASTTRPIRPRPRSRTASEVPAAASSLQNLDQIEEKRIAGLAEWRRRYGGKQRECVVCLEEYVDGVSRVMSLPCGHEFHEGCITPWLTTRRRTCPICKNDIVRSLARSPAAGSPSASSPPVHQRIYHDDIADDVQEQAALLTNEDPNSLQPVSREAEAFEDLERGVAEEDERAPRADR